LTVFGSQKTKKKNIKKLMKKNLVCIMLVVLIFTSACKRDDDINDIPNKITMETAKSVVNISLAGSGRVSIDWGDKSKIVTHDLLSFVDIEDWNNHYFDKYRFSHHYSDTSSHTITITSDNITHIDCYNNQLTTLNISKNPMLTFLVCYANQLTSLDVHNAANLTNLTCGYNNLTTINISGNTKLKGLACYRNQLTNLDVSSNTALEYINCKGNQLTHLDLSKNMVLNNLSCQENNFTTKALNDLFNTLHNNITGIEKMVSIGYNPGTNSFTNGTVINGWLIDIYL